MMKKFPKKEDKVARYLSIFLKINYIILILDVILLISMFTFVPAYQSYSAGCFNYNENNLKHLKNLDTNISKGIIEFKDAEEGYKIAGTFNRIDKKITVYLEPGETQQDAAVKRTIRHELIHAKQFSEGRLATCDEPVKVYLNELEAYIGEWFK